MQAAEEHAPIVFLPLLHGPFGEDGTVQGLLEVAGVPYVGAGVLGSALAMDKAKAKEVLGAHGLPQARWLGVHEDEAGPSAARPRRARARLAGVREAGEPGLVGRGVEGGRRRGARTGRSTWRSSYDEWVVVEEAVTGREIEVAVLGNRDPEASVPGEIVPSREFYDYEDKYLVDGARLVIPAAALARGHRRGACARGRRVRGAAGRGDGPRRLLLRGGRARLPRQRDQHDSRLHADLDVPEALGGVGRALPEARRPAGRARARAPRASSRTASVATPRATGGRPGR